MVNYEAYTLVQELQQLYALALVNFSLFIDLEILKQGA